jgi:hypothetical protein
MRVHPATTQRQPDTNPLSRIQDLALAVPANRENHDGLEVADDIESQGGSAADDEELGEVVQGGHNSRCADRVEDVGGDHAEVRDLVEEGDEGDEEEDGDGGLVEQQLGARNGKVFDLLADPDLVEGCGAEGEGSDDDAEELRLGGFIDGEGDADAGCDDGSQHPPRHRLAEQDEVDEDDAGRRHDLGQLVEADRVVCQTEVPEHHVSGEEGAHGEHVPGIQADSLEGAEGASRGDEQDQGGRGEMPHDDHELAGVELRIAEYPITLSDAPAQPCGQIVSYRLLRKMRPRVEKVLTAIQKQVISFSLRGSGALSSGCSYLGSSSTSADSRASMFSTRPSVDGRFSVTDVSRACSSLRLQGPYPWVRWNV